MAGNNKSSNKIRVTRLFGAGADVGLMDPVRNMRARRGIDSRWIVSTTSGNALCNLSMTSGGPIIAQEYSNFLEIDAPQASGFGWPASVDSVTFGHHGVFPNGISKAIGSGMDYLGGDGVVHSFSRLPSD